jgi:PhnB protein
MTGHPNQAPTGGLTPHIAIADKRGGEAIDFYKKAFGATEQVRVPAQDGVRFMHAHIHINGASLMMHDDFPEYSGGSAMAPPTGTTLHLHVDDTDAWFKRAIDAGATSTLEPHDAFWGDRYAQVKDPFGHLWSIGAPIKGEPT